MDFSINLKQMLYPYIGVAYSIASLKSTGYGYDGSAYHAKIGVGYELNDKVEILADYRKTYLVWSVANDNKNIMDLGLHRDIDSYNFSINYIFR